MADRCEKGKFHANRQQHRVQDPSLKVTTTSRNTCKKVCPTFVSDFQSCLNASAFDTVCTLYSVPDLGLHHLSA